MLDVCGPLDGYRVVEFSEGVAGPYCAMALADGGADVVKVERPDGDCSRGWGVAGEPSWVFPAVNWNKRSVAVDYTTEGGKAVVRSLLKKADVVVVDANSPAADSFGYESVQRVTPDIVYCSISGFGSRGPWAGKAGAELPAQLLAEVTSSLGEIGQPPVRIGTDVASMYAGIYAVQAICAALLSRHRTKTGECIDVSLFGVLMAMRSTLWVALSNPDEWWGFHLDNYVKPPFHGYRCSDGYLHFQFRAPSSVDWNGLLADLDMTWVKDEPNGHLLVGDNAGGTGRYTHVVQPLWDRGLQKFTREDAAAILKRYGAIVFPINDYQELLEHPQVKHLGIIQTLEGDGSAPLPMVRPPWQFSDTPVGVRRRPPRLGEHSEAVLRECGWERDALARLEQDGTLVAAPS